ncbi:MAG TPA: alcohol dehydrogenase catalytic domain-containing protein [Pyrinomonadaceae bacterium]|nr:alcohol dehydrogenase catalytic domain-containing protein [Pyrinomonadaceae bacterium]
MKALRIDGGELRVAEVALPAADGEAVVRVIKSGICGTDLELVKGYSGFAGTPGHEFVGVVETADRDELVGKRVVGEINAGCGVCDLCRARDARHCPMRTVLGIVGRDGAHAEFLKLPSRNLFEVPESISDDSAVFTEPLAAAVGITERVEINAEDRIAVVGDGKLGILCARALRATTPVKSITLIGKHQEKLKLAGKDGIETLLAEGSVEMKNAFDVVVEASGSESGFASALELVKPRGTIVLKSTFHGLPTWEASRVVVDEITVVGSRCGRFAPALDLLSSNQIRVDDLISEEFSLTDGVAAFERAGTKGLLKVLLRID